MNGKSLKDMMKKKKVSPENMTPEQQNQMEFLKSKVDQYKDKDTDELLRELDKLKGDQAVKERVQSGELDSFANTLKPMLNGDQQKKLDDLVRYLRRG